jgi:excisionase family DNA binding protein
MVVALEPRAFSVTQVAKMLGLSRASAYRAIETGDIPSVKVGGRIIIPADALDRLLSRADIHPIVCANCGSRDFRFED